MAQFVQQDLMTYCVGIKLNAGLVFLSDSRTNAGVDHISTFRKMIVYEKPGDRVMVLLSAGNLSISQSVREILQIEELRETREDGEEGPPITIWNAKSMFDAARVLGSAVRHVYDRDAEALKHAGLDFNVSFIFGGLRTGSGFLRATGVSGRITDVVQGLLVLSLLLPPAVLYIRERRRALAATTSRT